MLLQWQHALIAGFFLFDGGSRDDLLDRESERHIWRAGFQQGFDIRCRFRLAVISGSRLDDWQQLFQKGSEFEFREKRAQSLDVWLAGMHFLDIKLDVNIALDRHQLFAQQNLLAIIL